MSKMRVHRLEIGSDIWNAIAAGHRKCLYESNPPRHPGDCGEADHGFELDDLLFLERMDPGWNATGEVLIRTISHITKGPAEDVDMGQALMSIGHVPLCCHSETRGGWVDVRDRAARWRSTKGGGKST